jgi:hypothetical protein
MFLRNANLKPPPHVTIQVSSVLSGLVRRCHAIESWSTRYCLLFLSAAMLFYIVQRIVVRKVLYFSNIYYHTSFQEPVFSGDSAATTSEVRASAAMFVLLIVGN